MIGKKMPGISGGLVGRGLRDRPCWEIQPVEQSGRVERAIGTPPRASTRLESRFDHRFFSYFPIIWNPGTFLRIKMQSLQSFRGAYAGLLILRACFAIFGTGYIHPDEYFQNGEVTAGESHL